jgi:hypothetical protein
MISQVTTFYEWDQAASQWETLADSWESADFISYTTTSNNTLYSSGEYLVLANSLPYYNVQLITGIEEVITDSGVGTILKKEFRYSIDSVSFSEFQEMNSQTLANLGSFDRIWFQFRYILLSGGPVTITKVGILYTQTASDPFQNYQAPAIQDQNRVYAFPVTYKSNFLWEPYKMNRAIRLYKDLNLMVNNLFGHETNYYRCLPQGRSKDVFLMEYSLYDHDEARCVKVVVPNNEFPDNKLNMGPFGVDFELPFEVQIDKDYFQKIFGDGTGPQKRDVIYFPRTNRIYEISSSYLFRDFMNEPLYFKVTLIKWLPKTNAEQSESLNTLEDYTNSAGKLFGDLIEQEEIKVTNPQQFNVAYTKNDPVRSFVDPDQESVSVNLQNYYTQVAEYYYKMDSTANEKKLKASVDTKYLKKDTTYYVRFSPTSTQTDEQLYYSVKKLIYRGVDADGLAIFTYEGGKSQLESQYPASQIFFPDSALSIYENEYDGITGPNLVASCDTSYAKYSKTRIVEYKSRNEFPSTEDRAFSAWFNLKDSTYAKIAISSFNLDVYTSEVSITLSRNYLVFVGDVITLSRTSSAGFSIFGEVSQVTSPTQITVKVDNEILAYVQANFSSWTSFNDLQAQKTFSRVFLNGYHEEKGVKIELYENRHFKVTVNGEYTYFSIPGDKPVIESGKWHALFINFSNTFKQMTLNLWKMQWDPVSKVPATTDLKLLYNKTTAMEKIDRSSNTAYFLEPSFMDLTNVRLFNRVAETDKQVLILNQNIVKDAQWALIIDNALPQQKMPYIGYTR